MDGCVRDSRSAARATLPERATAMKASRAGTSVTRSMVSILSMGNIDKIILFNIYRRATVRA